MELGQPWIGALDCPGGAVATLWLGVLAVVRVIWRRLCAGDDWRGSVGGLVWQYAAAAAAVVCGRGWGDYGRDRATGRTAFGRQYLRIVVARRFPGGGGHCPGTPPG